MSLPRVDVFFYGSYINLEVLKEVDPVPEAVEVACLPGHEISIRPLANLARTEGSTVYGVLTQATHAELERLYAHARDVLGAVYLPQAVTVWTRADRLAAALCYIAPSIHPHTASSDYIDRILGPARRYEFPERYIEHLESFRP